MRDNGQSSARRHADRLLALGGSLLVHGIAVAAIVAFAGGAAEDAPSPPAFTLTLEWVAAPSSEAAQLSAAAPSGSTTNTSDAPQPMSEPLIDSAAPEAEPITNMSADAAPTETMPAVAVESTPREHQPPPRTLQPKPTPKTTAAAKPKPAPSQRADDEDRPTTAIAGSTTAPPGDSPSDTTTTGDITAASPGQSAGERVAWSVTTRTPPAYPMSARRRGIEGEVSLWVEVGSDGKPRAVAIQRSSGDPQLDEAATRAVEQWRFAVAAPMTIEIPILFRLNNNSLASNQP